jgi:predicted nucleotidyltransferase
VRATGFKGKTCFQEAEKLTALLKAAGIETKVEQITPTEEAHTNTSTSQQTGA